MPGFYFFPSFFEPEHSRFIGSLSLSRRFLQEHVSLEGGDDVVLIVELGDVERGLAVEVAKRHRRAGVHEKLHDVRSAVTRGVVQGGVLVLVHGVDLSLGAGSVRPPFVHNLQTRIQS